MGLSLTAYHFWYVKLGKPLTKCQRFTWDRLGPVPNLCTRGSLGWAVWLSGHKIGTSPKIADTVSAIHPPCVFSLDNSHALCSGVDRTVHRKRSSASDSVPARVSEQIGRRRAPSRQASASHRSGAGAGQGALCWGAVRQLNAEARHGAEPIGRFGCGSVVTSVVPAARIVGSSTWSGGVDEVREIGVRCGCNGHGRWLRCFVVGVGCLWGTSRLTVPVHNLLLAIRNVRRVL